MQAPVRMMLIEVVERAAADGGGLDPCQATAIFLEALRIAAPRDAALSVSNLMLETDGSLSFEGSADGATAAVPAACVLAEVLFGGAPPLALGDGSGAGGAGFSTVHDLLVALEFQLLRARAQGGPLPPTRAECRKAIALLLLRASQNPRVAETAYRDPPPAPSRPAPTPEEPVHVLGLTERDLHRGEATSDCTEDRFAAPGMTEETSPPPVAAEESIPPRAIENLWVFASASEELRPRPERVVEPLAMNLSARRSQWPAGLAVAVAIGATISFVLNRAPARALPAPGAASFPIASSSPVPAPQQDLRGPLAETTPTAVTDSTRVKIPVPPSPPPVVLLSGPTRAEEAAARRALKSLELGEECLRRGRVFQALVAFRAALEERPPLPAAARRLGDVYREREENDLALAAYQRYLQLAPEAPDAAEVRESIAELDVSTDTVE